MKRRVTQEQIQKTDADRLPFAIACINTQTLTTIVRTASLLGAKEAFVFGWPRWDDSNVDSYDFYIPVTKIYNAPKTIVSKTVFDNTLDRHGYFPVFIEQNQTSKPLSRISEVVEAMAKTTLKPCLIIGCSGRGQEWPSTGIPSHFMEGSEHVYEIPQLGAEKSYPAFAASSIAMWEMKHAFLNR